MEWRREDGYVVSDDASRLDHEFVWRWLSTESYWAKGRSRDVMERAIDGSVCLGLYAPSGEQVGFCRQVTDGATFAFLSDVFVVDAHRGSGAGTFLVETAVHHPAVAGVRQQTLRTADAHGLYAKFGYRPFTADERDTWLVRFADEQSPSRVVGTTHLVRHISAPRHAVYRALLDPAAVQHWMVPDGMTSEVHTFDARTGGTFRISLTYTSVDGVGKSSASTDTFHGRFVALEPDRRVVQAVEFETDDPQLQGEMIITYDLADAADGDGTELMSVHEQLPPGVSEADNELGWSMSLAKLAALLER